jgi:hypothetical protein
MPASRAKYRPARAAGLLRPDFALHALVVRTRHLIPIDVNRIAAVHKSPAGRFRCRSRLLPMLCPIVHEHDVVVFVRQSGLPNAIEIIAPVRRGDLMKRPQPGVPALDTAKHRRVQVS